MEKFKKISLASLTKEVEQKHSESWRFVQLLGVNVDRGVDLIYTFEKNGDFENLKIANVTKTVPSITDKYIAAFVFENETHDLFGVDIEGIAIDFKGKFYNTAVDAPMTVVSPEVVARKERQAKIEAAKAAKEAKNG